MTTKAGLSLPGHEVLAKQSNKNCREQTEWFRWNSVREKARRCIAGKWIILSGLRRIVKKLDENVKYSGINCLQYYDDLS